jgi:hypothetical protein
MITIYAGDSKDIRIPVHTPAGTPVDLSNATILWTLSEWAGGEALVTKTKAAATPSTQILIENGQNSTEPNQMVVRVLAADSVRPGGLYVGRSRISFVDATDTVYDDVIEIKDAPT